VLKFTDMNADSPLASVRLTTTGTLQLWDDSGTPAQIGSDSAGLSVDTWYRVEFRVRTNTSASDDTAELLLDGATVATTTTASLTTFGVGTFSYGWVTAPGASKVIYMDDIAVNDDQGANQNTYPGDGKVVLALPISDNAVGTGWTLGTGTAISSNGWSAVDSTPPNGVTNVEAGSDQKQIRNASSNASVSYDANLTTYTTAGIVAADTINVLVPIVATAAPVSTSAKQGLVGLASNPAITTIALGAGGVSGAFWSGATEGTYPSGWKISYGTTTYAPSVTLGTSPVMRITQVTSSTRIATVCFMGMYVDYTPAAVVAAVPHSWIPTLGPILAQ
jgi:hypothetical protein